MSLLTDYKECTKKLLGLLTIDEGKIDDREIVIKEINDLLEKRQELLNQLPLWPNISEADKKEMLASEKLLKDKMIILQGKVKTDLKQQQVRKKRINQYNDPYGGNISTDGMFYDKKK
jgi:flagellar protein FliT